MPKMKPTDVSHPELIKEVESVNSSYLVEKTGNPNAISALAIKIMARDRNGIPIPRQYKKTPTKAGYRHWQDVMVELLRRWNQ